LIDHLLGLMKGGGVEAALDALERIGTCGDC